MNVIVNGKHYKHITTKITRKATIEYSENTGTNIDGSMSLDPMGTRLGYTLTFDSFTKDQNSLTQLWNDLIRPRQNGILITMPYNDSEISFYAKVNDVSQGYATTYKNERIWDKITVSFESTTLNIGV
ncbi:MAG: hypothetical protein HFE51_05025 [Clostridia bacterium]|nr:hypothetical protein [Clostridia bacterium]